MTLGMVFALGACGEVQGHAVFEHGLGQFEYVVDRRGEAAVEKRTRAHRQHQRLTRARGRDPRK